MKKNLYQKISLWMVFLMLPSLVTTVFFMEKPVEAG